MVPNEKLIKIFQGNNTVHSNSSSYSYIFY